MCFLPRENHGKNDGMIRATYNPYTITIVYWLSTPVWYASCFMQAVPTTLSYLIALAYPVLSASFAPPRGYTPGGFRPQQTAAARGAIPSGLYTKPHRTMW